MSEQIGANDLTTPPGRIDFREGKAGKTAMEIESLPVACSLTDSELQERRKEVLGQAQAAMIGKKETETGFILQFSSSSERIEALANLIALEHLCCPFLSFRLTVEPGEAPVSLELSGPRGTKEFLAALFE